jgi:tetratricopeptide (TPR) repeat protein/tRNA A-37 threonylcarbamoyl transferase component Bud32
MGVVFKARQPTLDRVVAIKLLRETLVGDSAQHDRFVQEARAVARLQHPHLVQLYEFGEVLRGDGATSQPYLVLEYVSGGSLASLLRRSRLPPREAARLVETLAEAIHYAHQQGVIHRDLKPANILLHNSSSASVCGLQIAPICPKVTDFGLAKLMTDTRLTRTGDVLGTPSYMAPEQTVGKDGVITAAADVYGLGAILYETLTGRPPFAAPTTVATVRQVQEEEPTSPRRLCPAVPRDLETICLKCLRKEPGRRYPTSQELADDLRRFRTGEPIRARRVGSGERMVSWCRRKPLAAGLLAALAVVVVLGLSGMLWQGHLVREKSAEAEHNAASFKREHDLAHQQKERADRSLHRLREMVDQMTQLGRDLWQYPGQHKTALALLEQALTLYKVILAEEGQDPRLRREASRMYGEIANIYHSIGQWGKAVEAYRVQADLLVGFQAEESGNQEHIRRLADSHRARANVLRDLGEVNQARMAYTQAARIQKEILDQLPKDPGAMIALANTLLNKATLISRDQAEELEELYSQVIKLDQAAVDAARDHLGYQAELALGLEGQGMFFLATGRVEKARAAVGTALAIHQKLLAGGRMKGGIERYVARNYASQGRVLAAAGQTEDAEQAYREALQVLHPLVKQFPVYPYYRSDIAQTLARLADLLQDSGRTSEVEQIRRQVIDHYEILKANFPEDRRKRRLLVGSYLELVGLLCELGRQNEAAEPFRKALEVDPEDAAANNDMAWFLATCSEPRLRNGAEALRLAQKAVGANPSSASFWNTLGVAHYRNGSDQEAIAALEKAMRLRGGGQSFDWFFLAMAHGRLGNRDKAHQWLDQANQWMTKVMPQQRDLRRFRTEAEALLTQSARQ